MHLNKDRKKCTVWGSRPSYQIGGCSNNANILLLKIALLDPRFATAFEQTAYLFLPLRIFTVQINLETSSSRRSKCIWNRRRRPPQWAPPRQTPRAQPSDPSVQTGGWLRPGLLSDGDSCLLGAFASGRRLFWHASGKLVRWRGDALRVQWVLR